MCYKCIWDITYYISTLKVQRSRSDFQRFACIFSNLENLVLGHVFCTVRFLVHGTEGIEDFMKRTDYSISTILERDDIISWDIYARRLVFKWAGWIARLQTFDPHRITLAVLRYKNFKRLPRTTTEEESLTAGTYALCDGKLWSIISSWKVFPRVAGNR